jgi:hypothetical protein
MFHGLEKSVRSGIRTVQNPIQAFSSRKSNGQVLHHALPPIKDFSLPPPLWGRNRHHFQ